MSIKSGELQGASVDGLSRVPISALPTSAALAILGELNRVHQALISGANPGTPDAPEDHSEYYTRLVGIVVGLRTPAAALALVPAVEVSGAVQRRVARYGGDSAVSLLANLVTKRFSPDDAMETLGLAWFWSDSAGTALSDKSRATIVSTLAVAANTGDDEDMLGVSAALQFMQDPAFLALAQVLRTVAAAQGPTGLFTVHRLDQVVLPSLTAASMARTNSQLILASSQLVAAVCAASSTGNRHGTCQSGGNGLDNGSKHFASGQFGPARHEFQTVASKFADAYSNGEFTAAEYALISGDLIALLARTW